MEIFDPKKIELLRKEFQKIRQQISQEHGFDLRPDEANTLENSFRDGFTGGQLKFVPNKDGTGKLHYMGPDGNAKKPVQTFIVGNQDHAAYLLGMQSEADQQRQGR